MLKRNLTASQGADYSNTFSIVYANGDSMNLTSYTGQSQIRKHFSSNTYYTFTVAISGNTGQLTLSLNAAETANIPEGRYSYDCILTSPDNVKIRAVEGAITFTGGTTR